jgi:hypothetical protein
MDACRQLASSAAQGHAPVHEKDACAALQVSCVQGVAAIERFFSEIDRLNRASERPNPFLSAGFLRCYALRAEYHQPGREERLYVVRDGRRVIGCAPMRLSQDFWGLAKAPFHLRSGRLRFLAPFDTEQPGILCAAEDAEGVSAALLRFICDHERGWDLLELAGQRPGSPLQKAAIAAAGTRFRTRTIEVEPYNEISIVWQTLTAYFQSLAKKMRSNISRQARRLYANGEPELLFAEGAEATGTWFDAYCELDARSWKHGTGASIERHPRRVRFYREIAAGNGGLEPSFIGILLDGVLIAGLLLGSNKSASPERHGAWCLEMAYDQSLGSLGAGQLLLLLAVGLAIERGHRHLNFMQNFAYYKHRWAAEPIEVVNMQLIRKFSMRNLLASLGDLRKKWARKPPHSTDGAATSEAGASGEPVDESPRQPSNQDRARVLATAALGYAGKGIRRVDRECARAYFPFDLG